MGSPVRPAIANIYMCSFEYKWLKDCPHGLKSALYRRYVGDIFTLFSSLHHTERFIKHFIFQTSQHTLFVQERKWSLFIFFRHQYFPRKRKICWKETFSGVYSNLNSFIPENYKTGLIKSLLFWWFRLCYDFVKFPHEINISKSIL